jgi:hypothetical protein
MTYYMLCKMKCMPELYLLVMCQRQVAWHGSGKRKDSGTIHPYNPNLYRGVSGWSGG